jgi:protein transport protein SEC23
LSLLLSSSSSIYHIPISSVLVFHQYYEDLARQAANNGHAIDFFACGVDQVGSLEMQDLVKKTSGFMILSDTFKGAIFKNSFGRIFDIDQNLQLNMAFNATLEVQASRELKVCGAIGHCTAVPKKGPSVAETEIGIGGTTCWKLCSMDPNASTALYFEVVNQVRILAFPSSFSSYHPSFLYQSSNRI